MADRGREAAQICLWEYSCLFQTEQTKHLRDALDKHKAKRSKQKDECMEEDDDEMETEADVAAKTKASKRRTANLRIALTDNNILHKDWAIKLNSKYPIPVFCGRRPDKCPRFLPDDVEPDEDWMLAANQFAQRILVVFSPWLTIHHIADPQLCGGIVYDKKHLNIPLALIDTTIAEQGRTDFERLLDFMQANEQTFIGRCKNKVIQQVSDNLSTGATADTSRSILMRFRSRKATNWATRHSFDACQVDKVIGIPRRLKSYEVETDQDKKEDDELDEQVKDLKVLVDGSDFEPTEWQRQERLFCDQQNSVFDRIYDVDAHAAAGRPLPHKNINTLTDGIFTPYLDQHGAVMERLKNKTEHKTAPPKIAPKLGKAVPSFIKPTPAKQLNADQQRAIDLITPTVTRYNLFNARPGQLPVVPGHWMITGGPGTGMTCFLHFLEFL